MSKLLIVHLVDSRLPKQEIQQYIDSVTRNSDILHCFIFGGDPGFDESSVNVLHEHWYVNYKYEFYCTRAIEYAINFLIDCSHIDGRLSDWKNIFVNIRDMDDEYDDLQMLKELPVSDNVGIIRFNYNTDGEPSPYGKYDGDYYIKGWYFLNNSKHDSLFNVVEHEPHMIHRQFALIRFDLLERYSGQEISAANQGEDTVLLFMCYALCMLLGMGIKVCGSVIIGNYCRSKGQMSLGYSPDDETTTKSKKWYYNRFKNFTRTIEYAAHIPQFFDISLFDEACLIHLISIVKCERVKGNFKSLVHHLKQLELGKS